MARARRTSSPASVMMASTDSRLALKSSASKRRANRSNSEIDMRWLESSKERRAGGSTRSVLSMGTKSRYEDASKVEPEALWNGKVGVEPLGELPDIQDATSSKDEHGEPADDTGSESGRRGRYDNSLSMLTDKFLKLIRSTDENILDLKSVAEALKVPKRRIYDITNVLEGVGMMEKSGKNYVCLKLDQCQMDQATVQRVNELTAELQTEILEEGHLDREIAQVESELRRLSNSDLCSAFSYVTHKDIGNIPELRDRTVITIRAPPGTELKLPRTDNGGEAHQMLLKSPDGPIDCYLIGNSHGVQSTANERRGSLQHSSSPTFAFSSTSSDLTPAMTPDSSHGHTVEQPHSALSTLARGALAPHTTSTTDNTYMESRLGSSTAAAVHGAMQGMTLDDETFTSTDSAGPDPLQWILNEERASNARRAGAGTDPEMFLLPQEEDGISEFYEEVLLSSPET